MNDCPKCNGLLVTRYQEDDWKCVNCGKVVPKMELLRQSVQDVAQAVSEREPQCQGRQGRGQCSKLADPGRPYCAAHSGQATDKKHGLPKDPIPGSTAARRGSAAWKETVGAGTKAGIVEKAKRDHGLCSRCRTNPAEPDKATCAACLIYVKEHGEERRLLAKAAGQVLNGQGGVAPVGSTELVRLLSVEIDELTRKLGALMSARDALAK